MIWALLYAILGAAVAVADVYWTQYRSEEDTLKVFVMWPLVLFFGAFRWLAVLLQRIGHYLANRR